MSVRARLSLGVLVVVALGFGMLVRWLADDLKPSLRTATEESLVDLARVLASVASPAAGDRPDVDRVRAVVERTHATTFTADIHGHVKTSSDAIVYVTDARGIVLWDSRGPANVGKDLSTRLDVGRTLKGAYGARTSHEDPDNPDVSVMYVAAPVQAGRIVGVVSVGKRTRTVNEFLARARERMLVAAGATWVTVALLGLMVSGMVTRSIRRLADYARALRDGLRPAPPSFGTAEIRDLGQALEEMREALEGKRTVERYVRALTHEVKGPLSAIRGAAELLDETMEPARRARFLENIRFETARMSGLVERLMLLSSLEARKGVERAEAVDLVEVARDVLSSLEPAAAARRVEATLEGPDRLEIPGERFLLRQALANLVENAIDFGPEGSRVRVALARVDGLVEVLVEDSGPGIPGYALDKVFERFFSLEHPTTGKKSSGLGLSLVREIAQLHRGSASIENRAGGGAAARMRFPTGP